MKKFALLTAVAATLAGATMLPAAHAATKPKPVVKAHTTKVVAHPKPTYAGDAAVDKLNQQQLDQARAK